MDASRVLFKPPTIPQEIADYREETDAEGLPTDITLSRLHEIFQSIVKKKAR
ncbi:hypothetical protein HNQ56_002634 [Anaerotaenia torta]|uniref:hypothetical protein n=1 Tax=Anaerotaenia torta TaxID=433293 RepID=UPI003D205461